jgi:hypothetical protein
MVMVILPGTYFGQDHRTTGAEYKQLVVGLLKAEAVC